jgi:acetyl esterase
MKKKFTAAAFCGALMFMQPSHASNLSWWDMSPQEVRDKINQRIMSIEAPTPTVFSVTDHSISRDGRNTPIRIYKPAEGNSFPSILLVHGGAWVAGNLDTHDNLARYLCSKAKAVVVSVGYLTAPEGKFPLPLEQCYDTLAWISEHSTEISADTNKIAIVGDSAGGNMTAALCLMNRDRSGPTINLQVLINPAPDLTCKGTIQRQNDSLDMLRWQATQYLSDSNDASNPYVSPLVASNLSNLPPAVIILAEQDDLREAGQKYADRLQAAGVPTYVYCQEGVNHLAGHGAKASSYARESLDVAIAQIQKAFSARKATND